jgi:hypothetical protein
MGTMRHSEMTVDTKNHHGYSKLADFIIFLMKLI